MEWCDVVGGAWRGVMWWEGLVGSDVVGRAWWGVMWWEGLGGE